MKNDYSTLLEALNDLRQRGYKHDFNIKSTCLECGSLSLELHPADFEIEEFYRFEGMSNPDDNSIVYALQSKNGVKGVLVDAYGVYSEEISPELAQKLRIDRPDGAVYS